MHGPLTPLGLLLGILGSLGVGCTGSLNDPPPTDRFYYPSDVTHIDVPGTDDGMLLVVSANFDKRFERGWVTAVDLRQVSDGDGGHLPEFGATPRNGPVQLTQLGETKVIGVDSFSGEMANLRLSDSAYRVFIASRSEGMKVQGVDVRLVDGGVRLRCVPNPPAGYESNCGISAPTLTPSAFENSATGIPRAPSPFGVAVKVRQCTGESDCGEGRTCVDGGCLAANGEPFGDVWVSHIQSADSPYASGLNLSGYLVRLPSDNLELSGAGQFYYMGGFPTASLAIGERWVYATGRYAGSITSVLGGRDSTRDSTAVSDGGAFLSGLEASLAVLDTRSIVLNTQETVAYVVGRSPDVLMEIAMTDVTTASPTFALVRSVWLPGNPAQAVRLPREGANDLIAISCSGVGTIALYDQGPGQLVAQIPGVGRQPFGMSYSVRGAGVRLFVANFYDSRVAVIDIPDLFRPQDARLVAHIGPRAVCLTDATISGECPGGIP